MAMGEFDVVTYALIGKKLKAKADLVDGKIPASELPSYVDDVVEYASVDQFPEEGEASKIYVALDTGNTYRWSGSEYIQIGGGSPMVETTYDALKAARDAGTLVPGMQYRITDYQCTTSTANTQSAGHQFDIIVVADDESHLNEFARAAMHEGDTYFANCKLEAWQLWYCLDNDINRFDWADSTNGKGVVYRMVDEFDNDVPYDFKNILFTKAGTGGYTNAYTFCNTVDSVNNDASIQGITYKCYSNKIGSCKANNDKQRLNRTIFYSTSSTFECHDNEIGLQNHDNLIGNNAYYNIIGNSFYSNVIDTQFYYNNIATTFVANNIGKYFSYNTIDSYFYSNNIGNRFSRNNVGNWCEYNTIGAWISSNNIGLHFNYSKLGSSTSTNMYIQNCTFGENLKYISLTSNDSASSSNYIQNVHIHTGVQGSASGGTTNWKTITVSRNLAYETNVYPIGSTDMFA